VARFILVTILLIIVARLFWRVFDGVLEGLSGKPKRSSSPRAAVKLFRDPMCGTHVAPATALSLTAGGTTHYFCSEQCRNAYVKKASA
jgi:YHS domain-containing protein